MVQATLPQTAGLSCCWRKNIQLLVAGGNAMLKDGKIKPLDSLRRQKVRSVAERQVTISMSRS
jgi:hypothetical protein